MEVVLITTLAFFGVMGAMILTATLLTAVAVQISESIKLGYEKLRHGDKKNEL